MNTVYLYRGYMMPGLGQKRTGSHKTSPPGKFPTSQWPVRIWFIHRFYILSTFTHITTTNVLSQLCGMWHINESSIKDLVSCRRRFIFFLKSHFAICCQENVLQNQFCNSWVLSAHVAWSGHDALHEQTEQTTVLDHVTAEVQSQA